MKEDSCPVFHNPKNYLKRRDKTAFWIPKLFAEGRALDKCLSKTSGVRRVLDIPSGPGRLFGYWKRLGASVDAVDLSPEMVAAARQKHTALGLAGQVAQADMFEFTPPGGSNYDLVACVRFLYYFDRANRVRLLRKLAELTAGYVIAQYKTIETFRGRISRRRCRQKGISRKDGHRKYFCSDDEVDADVREAGLQLIHLQPISQWSDRAFALITK